MNFIIETEELSKRYGPNFCVDHVNMHVAPGKIYGLLGRNGAGKTTTIRMLLGLSKPTSGKIRLFGESGEDKKPDYRRVGSLVETPGFYQNLTGEENLKLISRLRGSHRKDEVERALKTVGLCEQAKKIFSRYSLGMKQRLGIAAAVMHEPELLILDEPINGLDPVGIHEIRTYLGTLCHEYSTTILVSSHILSEVEQLAATIGIMHNG